MAIPINPTFTQVQNEFATNSQPANIEEMFDGCYDKVFGNSPPGSQLGDFENTGQPSGDTAFARVTGATTADLRANIEIGGVETEFYFEYGIGNFNSSTTPTSSTVSDLVEQSVTGLTEGQEYQFRVVFWNPYNDAVSDRIVGSTQTFTPEASYSTPYNLNVSQLGFTEPVTVEATWDNATSAGIIIEWRKNGSSLGTTSLSGNTTSDTQGGFVSGDNASFRLRYTSGDTSWTSWVGTSIFTSS